MDHCVHGLICADISWCVLNYCSVVHTGISCTWIICHVVFYSNSFISCFWYCSAYSIFNEDFRELPGTLNADRLDRDIRAGQFWTFHSISYHYCTVVRSCCNNVYPPTAQKFWLVPKKFYPLFGLLLSLGLLPVRLQILVALSSLSLSERNHEDNFMYNSNQR